MVYIILPVHNEGRTVAKTASDLYLWCVKNLGNHKIIFVNDHSTDGTLEKLTSISSVYKMSIFSNISDPGKGQSLKVGFWFLRATFEPKDDDTVIFMDGDGQINPKEIKAMFNIMSLYDADAVIGNKRHQYSLTDYSFARLVVSRTFNFIARRVFGLPFSDTQCGIKAFKYSALAAVIDGVKVNKFAFDLELILALRQNKFRVVDAPITLGEQLNSGSVNMKNIFETIKDIGGICGRSHKSFYKGGLL